MSDDETIAIATDLAAAVKVWEHYYPELEKLASSGDITAKMIQVLDEKIRANIQRIDKEIRELKLT